ncbi:zinc-binding dehydrogenase [Alkalicella caledoniensis]|uniref:Zinc-binding dehydrogenase n=1 Tax=Alkalicella caledoniensis TaxID=2731377 RepID=A0A7G9W7Q9_ALKCA|nr:zinc-binding dehydrogenase [Alkalicella caledoniensis]QNO14721.1 zinc-binding dehydrogenase [Alkalicella caledoniensis]
MKTKAVRLYGASDLRLEELELPKIKDDEILVKVITDSICMSTYKAAILGENHKRVPNDVSENPIIVGHEFAGVIEEVGAKWQHQFKSGQKFAIQPALNYKGSMASPGYSYMYFGGNATYTVIPQEVMELGCLLPYEGEAFYDASLAEPMSCIIGAFHASYHTKPGKYEHEMGIVEGGKMALLAGCGPMGLGAIDYIIHCDRKPSLLVVTDIDEEKINRARSIFEEDAKNCGVELIFVNTKGIENVHKQLLEYVDGVGYNDVFVYAPVQGLLEDADKILGKDGCLNFFAGPTDNEFSAKVNFYNVHYAATHLVGTSGGNTDDMKESLDMSAKGLINPAVMVTHIGGLNAVADTTLNLPDIPGGKKLIYSHIEMDLTGLDEFEEKGKEDPFFAELAKIVKKHKGLWSAEAERFLLDNYTKNI